jgi:hypothetical protein
MLAWTLWHALPALFWGWVLFGDGAERLEGTLASGFLISWLAPTWSAAGIRVFAFGMLMTGALSFVVGLLVPEYRAALGG